MKYESILNTDSAPNIHWVPPPPPSDRHQRLCTPTRAYTNPLAASHRKKKVVILATVAAFVGIAVFARACGRRTHVCQKLSRQRRFRRIITLCECAAIAVAGQN